MNFELYMMHTVATVIACAAIKQAETRSGAFIRTNELQN